jgi:hypothetical protein
MLYCQQSHLPLVSKGIFRGRMEAIWLHAFSQLKPPQCRLWYRRRTLLCASSYMRFPAIVSSHSSRSRARCLVCRFCTRALIANCVPCVCVCARLRRPLGCYEDWQHTGGARRPAEGAFGAQALRRRRERRRGLPRDAQHVRSHLKLMLMLKLALHLGLFTRKCLASFMWWPSCARSRSAAAASRTPAWPASKCSTRTFPLEVDVSMYWWSEPKRCGGVENNGVTCLKMLNTYVPA